MGATETLIIDGSIFVTVLRLTERESRTRREKWGFLILATRGAIGLKDSNSVINSAILGYLATDVCLSVYGLMR